MEKKLYLNDIDEIFLSKCKWAKNYDVYEMFSLKGQILYNYKILDVYIIKRSLLCDCRCLCIDSEIEYGVRLLDIFRGAKKSCGCYMKNRNTKYKDRALIGTKINNIEILDIIDKKGEKTYWVLRCPFCDSIYISDASHTATGHRKSCGCLGKSFGEKSISKILKKLKISFKQEETFDDLLGDNQNKHTYLRYDFLIYENNVLKGSIEFDGMHHFSVEYQRGCYTLEEAEEQLRRIQRYDKLKDLYMLGKGIIPLHIKYTRKFDEIESQVLKYLKEINVI